MRPLAVGALVLAAVVLAACSSGDGDEAERTATPSGAETVTETTEAQPAASGGGLGTVASIPDVVQEVEPSVVAIELDRSAGSGVIWDESGVIVTNHHVVEGSRTAEVVFASGRRLEARVVATDPVTDLALLEVDDAGRVPAATFQERRPRVGELAVAVGNPFGFENSVTAGVVSGLERALPGGGNTSRSLVGLIQTDAAISPGNSGGALVNANGEVIGINVAYLPPQEVGAVSIGFAIPTAVVVNVVEQLLDDGEAEHAFLGVRPDPLTPQVVDRFDLKTELGILVATVVQGSAADAAGIRPGDVILAVDGQEMRQVEDLLGFLREKRPGDTVEVRLLRDDEERSVSVRLRDRPD